MSTNIQDIQDIQDEIVVMLRTVYDPEIPVNIYDLGLIYDVDVHDNNDVTIEMTLTSPNCPAVDFIMSDVQMKVEAVEAVNEVFIELVFDPPWDRSMMSEEALLELGLL
ncbi:MAG TPA: iron-sulfur cluster assembly protein [Dysgonamonadaceae bacterium]|nr:iron-sulfur cluster assembly protein [Dysgonamonadaceae bacterium]